MLNDIEVPRIFQRSISPRHYIIKSMVGCDSCRVRSSLRSRYANDLDNVVLGFLSSIHVFDGIQLSAATPRNVCTPSTPLKYMSNVFHKSRKILRMVEIENSISSSEVREMEGSTSTRKLDASPTVCNRQATTISCQCYGSSACSFGFNRNTAVRSMNTNPCTGFLIGAVVAS